MKYAILFPFIYLDAWKQLKPLGYILYCIFWCGDPMFDLLAYQLADIAQIAVICLISVGAFRVCAEALDRRRLPQDL